MGTQVTLTIPDELYRRAEALAKSSNRPVAEVLAEAIMLIGEAENALQPETNEAIERERAAYLAMHPTLLERYQGEYVAVYKGRIVDHDSGFATLYIRMNQQYPGEFVLIRKVEAEPEHVYYFRSPRFVKEK